MIKLLFVTQTLDMHDSVLGAYHGLVEALANQVEEVIVICLYKGTCALPKNVQVYSLGKERGRAPNYVYAARFLWLVWKLRRTYTRVFVHMNQEYVLLAGWLWRLRGIPVYLWRNHYAGGWGTKIAAAFCTKLFYTSVHSYIARFPRAVRMPVGVDIKQFMSTQRVRPDGSILFLARIAPSKRPEVLLDALTLLSKNGRQYRADIYGSPIPRDEAYYEGLLALVRERGLTTTITFHSGIPNDHTPEVYGSHQLFINCSPSGMFDKTLFEAAASGCVVIAASEDWKELAGEKYWFDGTAEHLALRIEQFLETRESDTLVSVAADHDQSVLVERLFTEMV